VSAYEREEAGKETEREHGHRRDEGRETE
jgi:hypothetical protein